jgi:hypothetical protein
MKNTLKNNYYYTLKYPLNSLSTSMFNKIFLKALWWNNNNNSNNNNNTFMKRNNIRPDLIFIKEVILSKSN